ncbi:Sua5 YciO YrdC YwlC family protein [Campylobacter mucosalis]|uniref:Threonylcarbamoyl-AMP synthase TsaC n=1 Tax=Campylobacter mucosalis CCUG 21559 TaxID=1032067 RepID=A0A6G5QES1_9BACT|nr:Sua5 YciO YrdC YwlC family protein [Campylobacter mucosalis]QCD44151.1 threonylcarbamoyl-AMP synthase TsaC [Campylobacter mucosalis CCUG 21559]
MIYLAQTDTTAGFLSKNLLALNTLKNRPTNQPCLLTTAKFSELAKLTRVPPRYKNFVRKSKKTTFLYPNQKAIRIVKDCAHAKFLADFDWLYSTSANLHNMKFDENWARKVADVVIDDTLFEGQSSKIFKISRAKIKKIR